MSKFKSKRTINNKPSAILMADLHLRSNSPVCRKDDFLTAQFKKLNFIFALAQKHEAIVLISGDVGNKPQWPNWLLEKTIKIINQYKVKIFVVLGQHDLQAHQLSQWKRGGCGVLHAAEAIKVIFEPVEINNEFVIYPFHYGQEITNPEKDDSNLPMIAMAHTMVVETKDLFPDQNAPKGHQLLKKYPGFSTMLSGDNHNPFVCKHEGRILCNPGSVFRTNAAQVEHKPRVYLFYAKSNSVEPVYLPIEKNVISREHIDIAGEKSDRMDAYLERLKNDVEVELSFEQNIENYFQKNRTQLPIKQKVFAALGG